MLTIYRSRHTGRPPTQLRVPSSCSQQHHCRRRIPVYQPTTDRTHSKSKEKKPTESNKRKQRDSRGQTLDPTRTPNRRKRVAAAARRQDPSTIGRDAKKRRFGRPNIPPHPPDADRVASLDCFLLSFIGFVLYRHNKLPISASWPRNRCALGTESRAARSQATTRG